MNFGRKQGTIWIKKLFGAPIIHNILICYCSKEITIMYKIYIFARFLSAILNSISRSLWILLPPYHIKLDMLELFLQLIFTSCCRLFYQWFKSFYFYFNDFVHYFSFTSKYNANMLALFELKLNNDRSSHQRCSVRKGVRRNFTKFTGKHLYHSLFLNQVPGLTLCKMRFWHRFFPVNFVKFLRTPFSQNTSGLLLLQ